MFEVLLFVGTAAVFLALGALVGGAEYRRVKRQRDDAVENLRRERAAAPDLRHCRIDVEQGDGNRWRWFLRRVADDGFGSQGNPYGWDTKEEAMADARAFCGKTPGSRIVPRKDD